MLKLIAAASLMFAGLAHASEHKDPYAQPNNSWISISGTVQSVQPDTFVLDYGQGEIIVEMDDGDRDADAYKLLSGDKVTVSGMIDDDFFEKTTIEASSVFVEKLGTHFFASAVDEEDAEWITYSAIVVSDTSVQGVVTDVDDEEFTIDTGVRSLRVEVDAMPYNPLDKLGYQKIRKGDVVRVSGRMDDDFLEGRELVADSVVTIRKSTKAAS